MKTWVVGDVHGCSEELTELVKQVEYASRDEKMRFVFLGDLIHKGPNSKGVIETVRLLLKDHPGSICIAGNHCEIELRKPTENLSAEQTDWIRSLPLLHQFEVDGRPHIAIHGGIAPSFIRNHPEGIGEIPTAWHKGGGKKMDRLRRFLRTRYVNPEGEMVPLGQEKPEDKFWADIYQGEYGIALFGHDPSGGTIRFFPNAIGLDTGCVFGGNLTAYCLEDGVIIQVAAFRKYVENLYKQGE
jgi:serine/threonine protein phosphatase 1